MQSSLMIDLSTFFASFFHRFDSYRGQCRRVCRTVLEPWGEFSFVIPLPNSVT